MVEPPREEPQGMEETEEDRLELKAFQEEWGVVDDRDPEKGFQETTLMPAEKMKLEKLKLKKRRKKAKLLKRL